MGTVNELLIVMAAAKFDPTLGGMTDNAARRCEVAGDKVENAFWSRGRYRPLHEYKSGPGQLYADLTGYRARISTGDVPKRDRNLAESRRKTAELGRLDVPIGQDSIPIPKLDDVPQLVQAVGDKNRGVRRYAVHALKKLGPAGVGTRAVPALIEALSDEDRYVRATAACALGNMGSEEARHALELATSDRDEGVRKAATKALRTF